MNVISTCPVILGKPLIDLIFTEIFSRAWTKAMTPANIVAGYDLPDIRYEKWKKLFHPEELSLDTTACKSSGEDIGLSEVDEKVSDTALG